MKKLNNIKIEHKRVLIVDHIKQSRDSLKIFAYSLGILSVATSYNSSDIFTLCESNSFDIILLGYDLGDNKKNGQQVLEELRVKNLITRNAIVIMITAEVSQAMVLAALEHKPDEYLTKPYSLNDLKQRVFRCFEKKIIMRPIYQALDQKDSRRVISLCNEAVKDNSPFKHEVLGIKSRQHFQLKEYELAKRIYSNYLTVQNCQWAAVGLGKIALIDKDYLTAEKYFIDVVKSNPFYLTAYDWLIITYEDQKNYIKVEEVLEKALMISPRSVERLEKYASICIENNHLDKATAAFSKNLDLSYHSIHKKPNNSINFAEAIIEHAKNLKLSEIKKLNNKAFNVLNTMTKDFDAKELKVIAQLLTTRLYLGVNDTFMAAQSQKKADTLLKTYENNLTKEGTFIIAKSLIALEQSGKANILLDKLTQENPENIKIISETVALSENDSTVKELEAAQAALAIGNSLYKAKHYVLAIEKFNQALRHFPNHTGVKFNLLQVLLVSFEKNRQRVQDYNQASKLIGEFESLSPNSESYKRFIKLKNRYESLSTFTNN